jgi:dTDP-4-amino-4,6-dideoxygalactose transaminase
VITANFTYVATAEVIGLLGLTPVLVDVYPDTFDINIEAIEKAITPKTKAIVFVHFGGNNRGLKELLKICKDKKIILIEDAAQAVGSDFWGKADFTCVSLQAIKTLTCGDGGFLICKNKDDHAKAKRLRWFGYDREEKQRLGDTDLKEAGYKYHMNDISAAIGLGNLAVVDKLISHRKKLMAVYKEAGFITGIWMTAVLKDYAFYKEKLMEHGYESGQHHYRNDKYTLFGGRQKFEVMDEIEKNYFFIPMHHDVTVADAKKIVKIIKTAK